MTDDARLAPSGAAILFDREVAAAINIRIGVP